MARYIKIINKWERKKFNGTQSLFLKLWRTIYFLPSCEPAAVVFLSICSKNIYVFRIKIKIESFCVNAYLSTRHNIQTSIQHIIDIDQQYMVNVLQDQTLIWDWEPANPWDSKPSFHDTNKIQYLASGMNGLYRFFWATIHPWSQNAIKENKSSKD